MTNRGSSLVLVLLILFAVLALGIAGLSSASSGLTISNNYRTGIQAMQAAESGVVHAIGLINRNGAANQGGGITTFGNASSNTGAYNWTTFSGWPTTTHTMTGAYSSVSYTITTSSDPLRDASATNTGNRMLVTSVGYAPGEATRTVKAHLALMGPFTCGAIDLPNTPIDPTFNGNSFLVDGNDYNPTTGTVVSGSTPTLGISTRNSTDTTNIQTELGSQGIDNVTGTDVGANLPSVGSCNGPSVDRVRNEIVPNFLNQACASQTPSCLVTNPSLNGNDTFGTMANPQITYYTGDLTIGQHGTMQGAGILIVDGGLTINGDVDFTGLIIVRGTTQFDTDISGHAQIYGALWTTNLELRVAGNAGIYYSSQALSLVNNLPRTPGNNLPQLATVTAWEQG